ncbi:hypothetical protein [Streptomyces thermodiastaticus]|jgi:hypothetical protein|uniref:hypothetical protein n=1 Tax=Streptomyces thermodiastaticus TaxID=44061 RepID=UPI001677D143|nr:hypothetical protein [Streptomyces thermodiastaticus]MCE7552110.1 hypothetical protein [Streptomyces thermodiastaticus]GHF82235.1 hypothetical protein GCM10018787_33770 [Streptomyces thermodiastaticus]
MSPIHHFHLDVRGHSVTVNLDCGRRGTAELLIDGKETGRAEVHGTRALLLRGELPTDPPVPVRVDITLGPGAPRCVAFVDGSPTLMPARPF